MRIEIASLTLVVGLAFPCAAASLGKGTDTVSEVNVRLHNAIVATPGTVERAKLVAKTIFAPVGVNVQWRNNASESAKSLLIDMLLTAGDPADDESGPLAEAFPFAGATGHIVVRYDRVRMAAGISRDLEPVLLGHVMVHEMTHVLQCLDRHSDSGVMKAHWTADDYCDMRWKTLSFTEEDVALLHLGIRTLQSRPQNQMDAFHLEPMH